MLRVYIIRAGVDDEYVHALLSAYPLLVLLMHQFYILQPNLLLPFSIPRSYPLQTNLRLTPQIHDPFDWTVLNKRLADWVVDFVLVGLEVAALLHDLAEDVAICEGWALGE